MDETPRDPASEQSGRSARRVEYIWACLVLAAAAALYFWTATSGANPASSKLQADDLYNRLSDGFLAGRLSFLQTPNPKLAQLDDPWDPAQNAGLADFHDVTYYNGKYFLYFGPAPAVLLLAPWKVLTGTYLGENVAAAIFAWLGAAASVALVLILRRRYFPSLSGWIAGVCLVGVAFGNFALPLLRRPIVYELAIASAYAFAMAALVCVARATEPGRNRRRWLFLAGLAYGLTLACRPNYLFGAVVLTAPFLPIWRKWREKLPVDWPSVIRDGVAVGAPLAAVGSLLLLYNALRFGNPLEFGTYYMLAGLDPQHQAQASIGNIPANLWFYLFAPAQWSAFFPFVQVIHMPWFTLPEGYIGEEDMFGILANMPVLWAALLTVCLWRDSRVARIGELRDLACGIIGLLSLNALVILRLNGASNRYFLDLIPSILPLACVGIFWLEQVCGPGLRRMGIRILWVGAVAFTAVFNLLASLQHNDLLRIFNPGEYHRMAHAADHLSTWMGQTGPSHVGPLRFRLKLPTDKTGQLEPLVVTGVSFRADFIYLFYTDEGDVQVGFEHTSYGGDLTKPPIEIDYAVEHVVEIEMGSLYPPIDSPYFDGMSESARVRRKHALRVAIDGHEVLAGTYDFYDSSPGDVSVGSNPVSDAFGRRFTGTIKEVTRIPSETHGP